MSLWWVNKGQLDPEQMALIESLPLQGSFLVTGPPGCGKTNVLLRRAQYVRGMGMPNVLLLTFTRPLTEFVKTGCFDNQGREIFPRQMVTTLESWIRWIYEEHGEELPDSHNVPLLEWKRKLAAGALNLKAKGRLPQYDTLFIDEAQDLLCEELDLLRNCSRILFFVGDTRQRIYEGTNGLPEIRTMLSAANEKKLTFHYRIAPEICRIADRILVPEGGRSLESTCHYTGPRRQQGLVPIGPTSKANQLTAMATTLKSQLRVYGDLIKQGDRLGIIVARKAERDEVLEFLEADPALSGKAKIIRAREDGEADYDPSVDPAFPVCIVTVQGCKGLEFRAVHWMFCESLSHHHTSEHYYTVVTRAKTSIDVYYSTDLPQVLARSQGAPVQPW